MHSVVGAVSTGTPSLVMQYSHKAGGVMQMVGMEDYVWDIQTELEECNVRVKHLWENRQTIRDRLAEVMPSQIDGAFALADVLASTLGQGCIVKE